MNESYDRNEEHLKLLGIGHYVMAGLDLLGCAGGAVYLAMAMFVPAAMEQSGDPKMPESMPETVGIAMAVIGGGLVLFSVLMACLTAYSGWSLHHHRNKILIYVVSAIHLLSMPIGTILGVLTIIVMQRPDVAARFDRHS